MLHYGCDESKARFGRISERTAQLFAAAGSPRGLPEGRRAKDLLQGLGRTVSGGMELQQGLLHV